MTEYTCEALQKGYAKKVPFNTENILICNVEKCPGDYKKEVHLDAEPVNICLVNGTLTEKGMEKSNLIKKVQNISLEEITIINLINKVL